MLFRFTDVTVGAPQITQDYTVVGITPQQCRLRDLTYAAEIRADIEFVKGKEVIVAKGKDGRGHTLIGRMPIMLRSDRCLSWFLLSKRRWSPECVQRLSM